MSETLHKFVEDFIERTAHRMVFDTGEKSMMEDIPRDKNYPADAVQCHDCGGLGLALRTAPEGPDGDCQTCEGKGWLPAGHPKGRLCENPRCKKPLPPDRYQVYCSTKCAFEDAKGI